jgi:hypothetical protein
LRLGANIVGGAGRIAIMFYDVVIFAPIAIERWIVDYRDGAARRSKLRPVPPLKRASGTEEAL